MKILQTGMGWFGEEAGGLSRYSSGLVSALVAGGDQSRLLVTGSNRVEAMSGGMAIPFASREAGTLARMRGSREEFARQLAAFDPDVSTFHFAMYARLSLGLVRDRPWVCHFHGPWAMESGAEGLMKIGVAAKSYFIEKPVYRAAPRLVTLSKFFADILRDSFGVPESRIRIVPGGFDPTPFAKAPLKDVAKGLLDLPPNRPLLVCVRRLTHRMGLENLIDAMAIVRREYPDILLAIAGKGPIAGELAKRIEERGLRGNVRMMGFVPDEVLPALYSAAEFSVVPTVSLEGFGLIVAESLACGTPVIATRAGALPELLESFAPQLLATTPAPADLARVIDSALRGTIGLPKPEACRVHARRWSWEEVVPKLKKVYKEARDCR